MSASNGWTPTQKRMVELLNDGEQHHMNELKRCLFDNAQGSAANVNCHLTAIRKKLRPIGRDVLCQFIEGESWFRQVRLLANCE